MEVIACEQAKGNQKSWCIRNDASAFYYSSVYYSGPEHLKLAAALNDLLQFARIEFIITAEELFQLSSYDAASARLVALDVERHDRIVQ